MARRVWEGDEYSNTVGMKLRRIPEGEFLMGGDWASSRPPHRVRLSEFWIAAFEVTNRQFEKFDPQYKRTKLADAAAKAIYSSGDDFPVSNITWCQAMGFCYWLSQREGVEYRLPTEAEWECAARGGLNGRLYPWGDEEPDCPREVACVFPGATYYFDPLDMKHSMFFGPRRVCSHPPNAYGLFEVVGNVGEYCWDTYDEDYYRKSPLLNPRGADLPSAWRVVRGGGYGTNMSRQIMIERRATRIVTHEDDIGFRVVVGSVPWGLSKQPPASVCKEAKRLRYPCFHPARGIVTGR
jgi:formylglycine-generating enzyme required for sulfatase activity